jgi:hypothetical protein
MFENEGMEVEQETQSDVTPETSSESQSDNQPEQQAAAPAEQKQVPFHEDPRIQDYMDRQMRKHAEAYESRLSEMQRQLQEASRPKQEPQKDPLIERLTGIDKDFGERFKQLSDQAALATKLQEQLTSMREQQFVERAVGRIGELNKSNSVSPEIASLYEAALDKAYREGKIRTMEDVDKAYNAIHEPFSKALSAREKAALDKYVSEKKAASAKPAPQPKGRVANPAQGPKQYANEQQRRASIVKDVVADLRAGRDLG